MTDPRQSPLPPTDCKCGHNVKDHKMEGWHACTRCACHEYTALERQPKLPPHEHEGWPKWVREIVEPLEAERDELKVGIEELTRILYSSDPAPWQERAMKMMREAEAERDTLKADIAEIQRKLDKAKQQRNEFRAALYDARTEHRAEVAALRASEVSRETLAEIKIERDDQQRMSEKHKNKYEEAQKEITKLKHKNHAKHYNTTNTESNE